MLQRSVTGCSPQTERFSMDFPSAHFLIRRIPITLRWASSGHFALYRAKRFEPHPLHKWLLEASLASQIPSTTWLILVAAMGLLLSACVPRAASDWDGFRGAAKKFSPLPWRLDCQRFISSPAKMRPYPGYRP